ncbi:MAG TPA: cyclodeaminase/cyclohydrolase family protein, partial [Anaerolineae bacterium]
MIDVSESTTLIELSASEFLARLAAPEPAPGGGSAAALAGASAAGLIGMVAGLALNHASTQETHDDMVAIQAEAGRLRAHLERLVDEDVAAYARFRVAHRLPRATTAESAARTEAIQCALHGAFTAPIAVAECCLELLHAARTAALLARPLTIPDVTMAALLAHAALAGSVRNALANLAALHDLALREHLFARLTALAAE